ncbi:MAG TPA: AAA family ATPase [Solirubrobacteraceae bacterium]|nr:AAA family ATPase [Solirubrobacteraceae bacterium]
MIASEQALAPAAVEVDSPVLAALAAPEMYRGRLAVEVHETHASWVFLAGPFAYKVKKPVRLAFLDYSTLARRRAACQEEVRVNRELAPGIYLGVRAIVAAGKGFRFAPPDTPGAVEYAVHMRRFEEADTLQGAIDARSLTRAQVRAVARRLADFHRGCAACPGGEPERLLAAWEANLRELERLDHPEDWQPRMMRGFAEAFVSAHRGEIEQRVRSGEVRDGHGDLRCEHVLLGPTVRVVDRIEFDPQLRQMDVAQDLAFLAMDLEAHGHGRAARELIGAYHDAGGNLASGQLFSFYCTYWALVRAKVAVIAAGSRHGRLRHRERARASRLWMLAQRFCWRARQPVAIVVCGTAGSGKSTLAAELARRSRLPVVSSDQVRKRHAGLAATERARPEHYTSQFTRAVYDLLSHEALAQLQRTGGVIVDATCHRRSERAKLFRLLQRRGLAFLVVRCQVTLETALARAAARMRNTDRISDATPEVVAAQFHRFEELEELPAASVLGLDGEQRTDAQVLEVVRAVDERMRCRVVPTAGFPRQKGGAYHPCPPR